MKNDGITGVTLIELSFVIFIVMGLATYVLANLLFEEKEKVVYLEQKMITLKVSLEKANKQIKFLNREVDSLNLVIDSLLKRPLPSCSGMGYYSNEFLVVIKIESSNSFLVGDELLNIEDLEARYKNFISLKAKKKCVPTILVSEKEGISADELIKGINKLKTLFYVRTE